MFPPPEPYERQLVAAMPMLKLYALKLCRNATRAEDLVQECMLRALVFRDHFEEGTNLRGWLVIILKNVFLNERRKLAREVPDIDGKIAEAVPVDDRTLLKMEAAEALRQVKKLPRALRAPLRLIIDGASYDEASRALRINAGTVRSRVNRARNLLKSAQ